MQPRISRKWYSSARWQARRAQQLAQEPCCRMCAARGIIKAATVADHIKPHRDDYEAFWSGPLQSLCKTPCHDSLKQREERTGMQHGCDVQGNPTDPRHHWN